MRQRHGRQTLPVRRARSRLVAPVPRARDRCDREAAMVAAAAIAANKKRQAKAKAKRDALRKQLENDKKEAEGFFNEISTDEGKTIPSDKLGEMLQRAIGDDHKVDDNGKAMVLNHLGKKQGARRPRPTRRVPRRHRRSPRRTSRPRSRPSSFKHPVRPILLHIQLTQARTPRRL
jgi:hypothetical protein